MRKKLLKRLSVTLALTLLISTVGPSFVQAKNTLDLLPKLPSEDLHDKFPTDMFNSESDTFEKDLKMSKFYFEQQVALQDDGGYTTNGVLGAGLKALKAFGAIAKNGGHMLSWILKPFSKKYADAVKRNGAKIGKALDKPNKVSRSYVTKKLRDAGINKSDAEMITKIIFWII
ncbi:hypothetical protein [Ornithinibacillus sp. FSL M8-0202]|uniref:hypothetical protein n=1 Tax=Ornithinibacillus sp. FSL M8-0202 TaxID=2921616 RepID=UPI0030D03FD8